VIDELGEKERENVGKPPAASAGPKGTWRSELIDWEKPFLVSTALVAINKLRKHMIQAMANLLNSIKWPSEDPEI